MHVSLKNNPLEDYHLQSVPTVDHSHKASASLAVEIILDPFWPAWLLCEWGEDSFV